MPPDSTPGVTAIIPAHNMERFLARALESALAQTYRPLEVIVIDDGSTDGTRALAERYAAADARVRVLSVPNAGLGASRDLGTRAATSHYVAYLDADDLWHPDKIARQVAALAPHGHSGDWAGCYALSRFIDTRDCVLANGDSPDARGQFFASHLFRNHVGNGSCLLLRRDTVLELGGFAAAPGLAEDYDFQLRFLRRYKLELVREFLVGYRVYPGQMSDDPVGMARAWLGTLGRVLPGSGVDDATKARALTHARIVLTYQLARERNARAALAVLGRTVREAPGPAARLLVELAGQRMKRRSAPDGASSPALPVPFAELDPADGVAAADDAAVRPRTRIGTLRRQG